VGTVRTVADILFGVSSQTLTFDAPEGRPSSITSVDVRAWDSTDDADDEFSLTGTVETNPNTTLDAAAGASQSNPRNIPLTATTGCAVGRTYLLTGAASLKEWVEVESVTSADSITARHPLHNDYASGATLQSTRITASVDNTWAADESNILEAGANPMYRVRWVYVVGGVTYVADTYFNLVRYGARHGVTPQDVEAAMPGWLDALPIDHRNDQGRRLLDEAYRTVKIDLHGIDLDDAAIAEAEIIDELVRYRAVERSLWHEFMASRNGDQSRHLAAKAQYQERLDSLLRLASKVPVRDASGAAQRTTALGLSVR
jgi:hypothetical protein